MIEIEKERKKDKMMLPVEIERLKVEIENGWPGWDSRESESRKG